MLVRWRVMKDLGISGALPTPDLRSVPDNEALLITEALHLGSKFLVDKLPRPTNDKLYSQWDVDRFDQLIGELGSLNAARASALNGFREFASLHTASSSGEGTDTMRPMSDDDASATSVPQFAGSDDPAELGMPQPLP